MCSRVAQFPSLARSMLRRLLLAVALTGSLMLAPSLTATAEAAPTKPAKATKVRAKTTTSTLTIRWKRPKRAKHVSVCVKTAPRAKKCTRFTRTRKTAVTFRKLRPNSGTDFYYQVRSHRGKRKAVTKWRKANLRVGTGPANVAAIRPSSTLLYTWTRATNASAYQVQVSPSRSFRAGVRTENRRATSAKVTGLNGGMAYFARVRGVNGAAKGPWGPVSRIKLVSAPARASVATYNLCGENKCRTSDSGAWFLRNVPKWAVRKPIAGALINSAEPDIIAAQEAATSTAFHTVLPGFSRSSYKAARSIYYKPSRFTVLDGGWMTLDDRNKRFATWNLFRDRSTGTAFFVANAHLEPYKGAKLDTMRNKQTLRLIRRIQALNPHNLPVVWAGDWNSNKSNANQSAYPGGFDAPKRRFAAIDVVNSVEQTPNLVNAELNSANAGIKTPRTSGDHVDAIYVPRQGVSVESWIMPANFVETESGRLYATPFPSDHNPIVARLAIGAG